MQHLGAYEPGGSLAIGLETEDMHDVRKDVARRVRFTWGDFLCYGSNLTE